MLAISIPLILLFAREALSDLEGDPELNAGYYQGDIRYKPIGARNGIGSETHHWPNATVPYVIQHDYFDKAQVEHILSAMAVIESKSCVRFQQTTEEESPLALIITGKALGCSTAALGFRNVNEVNLQPNKVGTGCFRIGSIFHELLHVLGFEHQHVAHNRDEYVRIEWDNIIKEYVVNFVNDDNTTEFHGYGEKYDYNSVMHYLPIAFSKNGNKTIVALKPGSARMGQRVEMSLPDIRKLNRMYKCPGYV